MKAERCPLCGSDLIEEVQLVRKKNDGSGSLSYEGSIDILDGGSMNVENVRKVYRCSNPECGYLNTDC